MQISFYLKLYALTVPIFLAIDLLWLGVVARKFYRSQLSHILSDTVNWKAAILFYLMYVCGILFFAVRPAIAAGAWQQSVLYGGLFGFFTYATYDLTNMALMKHWPLAIAIVDIIWGSVLCALVAYLSFMVSKLLT